MKMHSNAFWLGFLGVLAACVIVYSGMTLYRLYNYVVLSSHVSARDFTWSISEISSEQYALQGEYTFDAKGQAIRGKSTFYPPYRLLNPWAAEQAIHQYQKKPWKIWYNPRNPHHSALQKNFPLKECISSALLWGLLIYFMGLGIYVKKYDHA